MAELTPQDVEDFTNGRMPESDDETQRTLDAALVRVRRYCGWHVSPARSESMALDVSHENLLVLPTRKLNSIVSITESGSTIDVASVSWSTDGFVRKISGGQWTSGYRSIVVVMDHGYTDEEAADWRRAVLSMTDQMSRMSGLRSDSDLVRKRVDDVEYQWVDYAAMADRSLYSVSDILDDYALAPIGFA